MKKKINPINIFIIISAISVIISFFTFVFGNDTFSAVNATGGFHKLFNDFIFHLYLSDDLSTVYTKSIHICFPPLIYLFYHALNLMMPPHAKTDINYNAMYNLCVIYLIIGFLIFAFIKTVFKKAKRQKSASHGNFTNPFKLLCIWNNSMCKHSIFSCYAITACC